MLSRLIFILMILLQSLFSWSVFVMASAVQNYTLTATKYRWKFLHLALRQVPT